MAKMGVSEMMGVLQAYATGGEEIQFREAVGDGEWTTTSAPAFNFSAYEYRIKPKPRKFYACVREDGEIVCIHTRLSVVQEFAAIRKRKILTLVEQV